MRVIGGVVLCAVLGLSACGQGEQSGGDGETAAGSGGASSAPASGGVSAEDMTALMSKRKAGKWRMSMGMAGLPASAPQEICITPEQIQNEPAWDPKQSGAGCPGYQVKREGGVIVTTATCPGEGGSVFMESRLKGDFETAYRVDALIRQTPAPAGQTGEVRTFLDMQYLGPC